MKKSILFLLFCLIITSFLYPQIYSGKDAGSIIQNTELLRYKNNSSIPEYIRFIPGKEIDYPDFQKWMNGFTKKLSSVDYLVKDQMTDRLGYVHFRYQQYIKGYPVEFSIYLVHVKNGKIYSMNGFVPDQINLITQFEITENEALNKAKEYIGADVYQWELPSLEMHLKKETSNPNASYYPKAEKVIIPAKGNISEKQFHSAYKFDIYAHKPLSRRYIYIDASTGDILFENKTIHTADVTGTAVTAYSGTQTLTTDSYSGSYRLRETGRGNGIETYDMNMTTDYGTAVDFTDTDNNWNNVNAELDQYAADAHWATEMTYDYYYIIHGRNSINNSGFALKSYVHFNLEDMGYPNNVNAFWDGQRMSYGDGDGSGITPLTTVDICGHEVTHGLTSYTADLIYQDESGALNEGFSDIFGTCIEYYAKPSLANWTIGEDIGSTFRGLDDPNAYGLPDTYLGNYWETGSGDNGGVHTNCGVLMHWFYLTSQGGSGTNDNSDSYTVTGIGMTKAADIAFRMLTVYLVNSSQYDDARFYAIQSAQDLYGVCTPEVAAVTNAMYAVGLGNEYLPYVVSDFNADITQACTAPFTVNFTNQSVNGQNFSWDFGDGGVSSLMNPSHTFNSLGTYNITLSADGGTCGNDIEIKNAYIVVDTALPCIAIMPTTGTYIHYGCDGTLYDSGGPSSNYPDQTDVSFTISPLGADQITINVLSFDFEAGSGSTCDYDYLAFYDGPNTSSPLINGTRYCNTTGSPGTITSTGGSITVRQYSDQAVNNSGFELDWICSLPTTPPIADFNAGVTTTCDGVISFFDHSEQGPMSWLWDFGDGSTSNLPNPTHIYNSTGVYTVTLIASNNNGSDTMTITNYISVNLLAAPTATGDTICINETATLNASGSGDINWYNDISATVPVYTGNTYVTPPLTTTTIFYAQNSEPMNIQNAGETNSASGGGYFTYSNQHGLKFNCITAFRLLSVEVNAQTSGFRVIELTDASDNILQTINIDIPAGTSRIDLNFDIPVGNGLKLMGPESPYLYRTGGTGAPALPYPYEIPGILSIYSNTAENMAYYYYFYDWEVAELPCVSPKIPVEAFVDNCIGISNSDNADLINIYPNPITGNLYIEINQNDINKYLIEIYDNQGNILKTPAIVIKNLPYSRYIIDLSEFAGGVYFCKISSDDQVYTKPIVLIK